MISCLFSLSAYKGWFWSYDYVITRPGHYYTHAQLRLCSQKNELIPHNQNNYHYNRSLIIVHIVPIMNSWSSLRPVINRVICYWQIRKCIIKTSKMYYHHFSHTQCQHHNYHHFHNYYKPSNIILYQDIIIIIIIIIHWDHYHYYWDHCHNRTKNDLRYSNHSRMSLVCQQAAAFNTSCENISDDSPWRRWWKG